MELLKQVLIQNGLPSGAFSSIQHLLEPRQCPKNTTIVSAGDIWDHFIVAESGILRAFYLNDHGREANSYFAESGNIIATLIPESEGRPATFSVESLIPSRIHICPASAIKQVLRTIPDGMNIFSRLTDQLLKDKLRRERMFLQMDATERYRTFCASHPGLHRQVPLVHIASYLGMTDVTLSRVRKALQQAGQSC